MGVSGGGAVARLTIAESKRNFFDRPAVMRAVERARVRNLSKIGAYVRTRAISLLLRHHTPKGFGVKTKISNRAGTAPPGQPPYLHQGDLARFLFFAFDSENKSVVIGPALYRRSVSTLRQLEEGGQAAILVWRWRHGRREQVSVMANFRPHPFMRPALEQEKAASPKLWQNTIK